ncbi:MAG TPA: 50S ribosomal protein L4 [Beutenbergiaceae bacterium]|nr:50S ribosomal protein L4 [Beutenbergiaceae bacterium]
MAAVVDVVDATGKKTGTAELPAEIFDVVVNVPLIHQVVVAQQAAARQGTHKVKTRGEVRGGGRKPWRQKGTGRARHGSIRSPQWTGGGIVHGPSPRDYSQRTPKKMKAAALRGALSDRARGGCVHVVENFGIDGVPSTRAAAKVLEGIGINRTVLAVITRDDDLAWKSLRNLQHVHLIHPDQINTYDVLVNDEIVFTSAALEQFVAGPPTGKSVTASASSAEVEEEQQ